MPAEVKGKKRIKRLSISTAGHTLTVIMTAVNMSEAINQEIDHYWNRNQELAQVNLSLDK